MLNSQYESQFIHFMYSWKKLEDFKFSNQFQNPKGLEIYRKSYHDRLTSIPLTTVLAPMMEWFSPIEIKSQLANFYKIFPPKTAYIIDSLTDFPRFLNAESTKIAAEFAQLCLAFWEISFAKDRSAYTELTLSEDSLNDIYLTPICQTMVVENPVFTMWSQREIPVKPINPQPEFGFIGKLPGPGAGAACLNLNPKSAPLLAALTSHHCLAEALEKTQLSEPICTMILQDTLATLTPFFETGILASKDM